VRCICETIDAGRQKTGEAAWQKQIARAVGIFQAEQHRSKRAAGIRQREVAPGFGLKAARLCKSTLGRIELACSSIPACRRHEPDRNGAG
jgi:hypothetical protein